MRSNNRLLLGMKGNISEFDSAYQIGARNLDDERVIAALGRTGRPCRVDRKNQIPMFPDT